MPKPAPPPPKIHLKLNLLRPQGIPEKLPVRFLKWLLSYGRYMLVFVELIVLSTFAMRFKLDADLADLKEQIEQQIPYVQSLKEDEILIRQTQFKLDTYKTNRSFSDNYSQLATKIASFTPLGVRFVTFTISTQPSKQIGFRISGEASSNRELGIFLTSLKNSPDFSNVNLANISLDEGVVNFAITGDMK